MSGTLYSSMVRENLEGTNWLSMASHWDHTFLRIRSDGSLWIAGLVPSTIFGEDVSPGWHPEGVRVGTKSDWVALSGYWQCDALEADGTLWAMDFYVNDQSKSKHPSKYADWLAASEYGDLEWGLARDGTLT